MGWDHYYSLPEGTSFGAVLDAALARCDALEYWDVNVGMLPLRQGSAFTLQVSVGLHRSQIAEEQPVSGKLASAMAEAEADGAGLYMLVNVSADDRRHPRSIGVAQEDADNHVLYRLAGALVDEVAKALGGTYISG
jgi:hypothetical protein